MFFNFILGECLPERDAAAAPALSRHPELSWCVVSQRRAPGGASRCGQDTAGPQSGGGGGSQSGGGQRARGNGILSYTLCVYVTLLYQNIFNHSMCSHIFAESMCIMM